MSETDTHNSDLSFTSPGVVLKRCREYHRISLEEAAEATKIGINYLNAMECDQVKEFASLAYLKGFLRIYASYLGLNPDDILKLSEKMYAPAGASGNARAAGEAVSEPAPRRFSWQKFSLPAFLLLLLLITSFLLNRSSKPQKQTPAPQSVPVAPAPAVQAVVSSARTAPAAKAPETKAATEKPVKHEKVPVERSDAQMPTDTSKGFIVRMKVTQNGTLAVTIDGAASQNYDLSVGDVIEWKAEKNIALELSNAGGVEAELNGKPLRSFGPAGNHAYVVLDANGVKE